MEETKTEEVEETFEEPEMDFTGEELSIIVSQGWMDDERYAPTIARFEEEYGVTVDLQTIPSGQYFDILKTKLDTGTCSDIFWIQSNPFAIKSFIVDPETYCIDFTGEDWQSVIPEDVLAHACLMTNCMGCSYGIIHQNLLWFITKRYLKN